MANSSIPENIPEEISTCNLSDAMGRGGSLGAFRILSPPKATVYGRAVTCETNNGDWWAVVKAIDSAGPGDVIVAKSLNGCDRAVMGELLANSAKLRGVSAIVIDGAVRDLPELMELALPIYARSFVPNAGDPKREGKIGIPITVNGVAVNPGDMVACDGSGVVVVNKDRIGETLEKAKGVVDKENAIRKQILAKETLSDILNF